MTRETKTEHKKIIIEKQKLKICHGRDVSIFILMRFQTFSISFRDFEANTSIYRSKISLNVDE